MLDFSGYIWFLFHVFFFIYTPLKMWKSYLVLAYKKQASGQIWPVGHSLLTLD